MLQALIGVRKEEARTGKTRYMGAMNNWVVLNCLNSNVACKRRCPIGGSGYRLAWSSWNESSDMQKVSSHCAGISTNAHICSFRMLQDKSRILPYSGMGQENEGMTKLIPHSIIMCEAERFAQMTRGGPYTSGSIVRCSVIDYAIITYQDFRRGKESGEGFQCSVQGGGALVL